MEECTIKPATIEDLLDLTLREVLENYSAVQNLECGFFYGICKDTLLEDLFQKYNIEKDYPEAFNADTIINSELLVSYQDPLLTRDKLERIMDNLGITRKEAP